MGILRRITFRFMIELQRYLDFEEIFSLFFKYKMLDVLFEVAESTQISGEIREQFAIDFFRYTLSHGMMDMTILVCEHYRV